MAHGNAESTGTMSPPRSALVWQNDFPDTAHQAIERKIVVLHYSPNKSGRQSPPYRPLTPNVAKASRVFSHGTEGDMVSTSQSSTRCTVQKARKDSTHDEAAVQNVAPNTPWMATGQASDNKRQKLSVMPCQAATLSRQPEAGYVEGTSPTPKAGGVDSPLSGYKRAPGLLSIEYAPSANRSPGHAPLIPPSEPSCYVDNLVGACPSSEAPAASTYSNEAEVVDLISSNGSSPQHLQPKTIPANSHTTPPKLTLKFKQPGLPPSPTRQLQQPYGAAALDSDGTPYPSPYCTVDPSILSYDAATPKKRLSSQPAIRLGKGERYTSVLEHELAITKTKLAKSNSTIVMMQREREISEKENHVLKKENEMLKKELGNSLRGQDHERSADEFEARTEGCC